MTIKTVFVHPEVHRKKLVAHLRKMLPDAEFLSTSHREAPAETDKSILYILPFHGHLLKPCPATSQYNCCNYQILNTGLNCTYSCTYCILQDYFDHGNLVLFGDIEDYLETELLPFLQNDPHQKRIGTGEFTDSLILDPYTHLSSKLIDLFRPYATKILELKTKSLNIEEILATKPSPNTIISWSLTTPYLAEQVEADSPSVEDRIQAAKKITDHGFDVGFHFDPIILYDQALPDYEEVIHQLYAAIPGEKIRWISLGMLRFTKGLKPLFLQRSPLFMDEFILAPDHKFRYLRFRREKTFKHILDTIRSCHNKQFVYLCMESDAVWEKVFGFTHDTNEHFDAWFNDHVFR